MFSMDCDFNFCCQLSGNLVEKKGCIESSAVMERAKRKQGNGVVEESLCLIIGCFVMHWFVVKTWLFLKFDLHGLLNR